MRHEMRNRVGAAPSATGRTTAKGRPLVGKLFVKPGANDTQEIWYTVIK